MPTRRPGRLEMVVVRFGIRSGRALADEVRDAGPRRPRLTLSTATAYLICVAVYALIASLAWFGITTLLGGHLTPISVILIGISLGLAWVMLPRPYQVEGEVLDRQNVPSLFELVDGLASILGARRIDGVVVNEEMNASFGQYGWRRRRIMSIGLPLYWSLEPQMRVALLAHELGHGMNRDPMRGFILGGGVNALVALHQTLEPEELVPRDDAFVGLLALPLTLLQRAVSRLVLWLARVLVLLVLRSGQRAEYYADAISARAAGRHEALALLERLHAVSFVARMVWLDDVDDPIAKIARKVRSIPPREIDRIHRIERLSGSRLDYAHPPTAYRIEVLEAQPELPPAYVLDAALERRIDVELEPFRAALGRRIVNAYDSRVGR